MLILFIQPRQSRKHIYQKFAFQAGGDLQEKFEAESELYKLVSKLQKDLQGIIFSLEKSEDRLFLLKWAEKLLDLQVDDILDFVKNKELSKISLNVLTTFQKEVSYFYKLESCTITKRKLQ
ncbi:hypothetical protein [Clostridium sp. FP1]|uniref:hypothetical protein n=1 Tax=Clostridium sp. FP1 TaxID=2724076 RepID=UPI001CC9CD88|nr:hypothetical protein [Clostridium sp. FP1]MBZ9637829.1 hypothetical protein [Clostridium sp. FP1]